MLPKDVLGINVHGLMLVPLCYALMTALVRRDSSAARAQPRAHEQLHLCARRAAQLRLLLCMVTFPRVTTTFTGPGNRGLQVGHNSGSIETHIHAPDKCPPAPASTSAALIALLYTKRPETTPQPSCFVPFRRDPSDFVARGTLLDQIRKIANQVKVRGRKDPQADVFKLQ
jgi:hypothetical protein